MTLSSIGFVVSRTDVVTAESFRWTWGLEPMVGVVVETGLVTGLRLLIVQFRRSTRYALDSFEKRKEGNSVASKKGRILQRTALEIGLKRWSLKGCRML